MTNIYDMKTIEKPEEQLLQGKVGKELTVLSKSQIRIIRVVITEGELFETMDGLISGQKGDYIVQTPSGEEYPIKPSVFFGAYEVLANFGDYIIGQRLIHERRAWPVVTDEGAEFNYAEFRGPAFVQKGGWLYQTAENDYGLINKQVNEDYHTVVGDTKSIMGVDWISKFHFGLLIIALLSPILSLLALSSFTLNLKGYPQWATITLVVEIILLGTGLAFVWWIKRANWRLKAAFLAGRGILNEFQIAVKVLGFPQSKAFPGMTIWRAAQSDEPVEPDLCSDNIKQLKIVVAKQINMADKMVSDNLKAESMANALTWLTAIAVLACAIAAAITHYAVYEAIAIWLPSIVGFALSSIWRRESSASISAAAQLKDKLTFIRKKLGNLARDDLKDQFQAEKKTQICALIKSLCLAVGLYSQSQVLEAMSQKAEPPV